VTWPGPGTALLLTLGLLTLGCRGPRGPHRPWVHKVYLHGVKKLKAADVKEKTAVQQSPWFPLAPRRYLDQPLTVEVDRERIATYYQTRGYFSAQVPQAEIKPYKKNPRIDPALPEAVQAVDVHFQVQEGEPTHITAVNITGLDALPPDDARYATTDLPLTVGKVFEHQPYLLAKELLVFHLRERGYAFAKLDSAQVEVDRDARTARIAIVVSPGRKVRLGSLTIRGTDKVDAAALYRHAPLPTGDPYSPSVLAGLQGRLYSLGLFSTVQVEAVPDPEHPDIANVVVQVSEGKHRDLRIGAGVGIEPLRNDVHAELLYTQRRFLGGLRVLNVTVQPGYAALPAVWADPLRRHGPILLTRFDLTQPDLLGKSSALTASLSYDLGVQYAYQYHGPSARLGISKGLWRDRISLSASYNFQFLDFFEPQPGLTESEQAGQLFGFVDPYRLGYFQEQIALDLRDRPVDATRGFYAQVIGEQGGVYTGSAFSYQKIVPEVRAYYTLFNRLTVAARLQYGQIFVQGDLGSPITQRFYLGGPNSHRGFSFNRLSYQMCSGITETDVGPLPQLHRCNLPEGKALLDRQRVPTGGDQLILGQFELRLRLLKLFGEWLSVTAFTDIGDVAPPPNLCQQTGCKPGDALTNFDLSSMHIAVGGGIRYRTVIGTIRFDLGVRLNRLEEVQDGPDNPDPDQRFAYHISIGEAF
jgi:translocation and assembly module TamA